MILIEITADHNHVKECSRGDDMEKIKVTERMITNALDNKYKDDIFARQVKLGPAGSKILDAVRIEPKWSPITVIGYEIKVSRNDFLNDNKYPHYMKSCTNFNFVVPKGIIKKDEVPANVGVIEYNPVTNKFRTLKKSPYLDNDVDPLMLLHIMFWKFERYQQKPTREQHIKDAMAKIESRDYGHELGRKLYKQDKRIEKLNEELQDTKWSEFKRKLHEKTGIEINYPFQAMQYFGEKPIDNNLLDRAKNSLNNAMEYLEKI